MKTKTPKNIDIHAHANFADFAPDRDEVIDRALRNGIYVINVGTNYNTSIEVVRLAEKYDGLYATVGLHPINVGKEFFDDKKYTDLLGNEKVVAVGECGFDFFHLTGDIDAKKLELEKVFRAQIELAVEFDKPIIIHCRDAYNELLGVLRESKKQYGEKLRGDVHFFGGSKDVAKEILDLDFDVSFTGVITFAPQYRELVLFAPLDRIHAETDCPYVAPVPHRGKRNEPSFVIEVVKEISEIKGLSEEKVSHQLVKNAKRLFNLPF